MTLYDAMNNRLAFYRQVALFGLQHNKSDVVAMCIDVMNDTLPKEFRPKLPDKPSNEHKLSTVYDAELLKWCFKALPVVEGKYTEYMQAIAMQYTR